MSQARADATPQAAPDPQPKAEAQPSESGAAARRPDPFPKPGAPGLLALADWRRRVASLYAAVRAAPQPSDAWTRWRAGRDALFRAHPCSPLADAAGHSALLFAPYDPTWRFTVGVTPVPSSSARRADGGADGAITFRPFAKTRGLRERLGTELTLFWIEGYGGGVFLPFRDRSNGRGSYGGGRYLLDGVKGADLGTDTAGRLIVDFNFAYNPSCAYSAEWVCPLSPPENRLSVDIPVGEQFEARLLAGGTG